MASYTIRPARPQDADALAALAVAAVHHIGPGGYTAAQVEAWAARHPGAAMYRDRLARGDVIFVAADDDDVPVAYALLEPDGHLDRLYNHPMHTRRGLAARLLAAAEQKARASGLERLYTEASELARPSFERAGYRVVQRRDFTIRHDGENVPIHNYAMEKRL